MRSEDVICLPHRRWTSGSAQVDLSAHDDIIKANKQHRRLIRQYGRAVTVPAFNRADHIVREWREGCNYCTRVEERMHRFHGDGWRVSEDDPTLLASYYPTVVALARLLASPKWTALALDSAGNKAFVAEVRRTVEPRYAWAPVPYWRYVEPLARTLLEEQKTEKTPKPLSSYGASTFQSGGGRVARSLNPASCTKNPQTKRTLYFSRPAPRRSPASEGQRHVGLRMSMGMIAPGRGGACADRSNSTVRSCR